MDQYFPKTRDKDRQEGKKAALITGANKGIGFEVARQIAKAGWTVLAAARSEELGWQAVVKLQAEGLDVQYIHIDLDAPESATIAAETTRERFGKLDLLVNNAGYSKFAPSHLLLGSDAVANLERVDGERRQAASKWRNVSASVDYGSENIPDAV